MLAQAIIPIAPTAAAIAAFENLEPIGDSPGDRISIGKNRTETFLLSSEFRVGQMARQSPARGLETPSTPVVLNTADSMHEILATLIRVAISSCPDHHRTDDPRGESPQGEFRAVSAPSMVGALPAQALPSNPCTVPILDAPSPTANHFPDHNRCIGPWRKSLSA